MTKPIWSHVLAFSVWTEVSEESLKIAHIDLINYREAQTIPDCIIYILLVSFAMIFNHRRTFLLHTTILACVKAKV